MKLLPSFTATVPASGSMGLGAPYYTIAASYWELSFAAISILGGLVFSRGLALMR
jgi:hypothetical protein